MSVNNEESIDLPLSIVRSNGVPQSRRFENTGEVNQAVSAAVNSEGNTVEALAKLILATQSSGGGGNGGDDGGQTGAKVLKDIKKHKWIAGFLALILGPGGMTATYYAIKDRGIANAASVQMIKEEQASVHPQIKSNARDIVEMKTDLKAMKKQLPDIAAGIESLKQVNVNKLEKENEKLERKIRILERTR